MAVIALDLGGTKLARATVQSDGSLSGQSSRLLGPSSGAGVGRLICNELATAIKAAEASGVTIDGVGVSIPGIYYPRTGHAWVPNISGWEQYPLLEEIREAAGPDISVCIDSDRACHLLGECWQGAARGCRHAVLLAVGTGIGAGILVDGQVLRGAGDAAGAIGWMAVDRPFRAEYAPCGCFEYHASGPGLAKVARAQLEQEPGLPSPLRIKALEQLAAHDVFAAWEQGDKLAGRVIANAVECWGIAAANLVSLFNPEVIIFGGGLFGPAKVLIDAVAAEARRWAQPVSVKQVRFAASELGSDAALYGAAYLALGRDNHQQQRTPAE